MAEWKNAGLDKILPPDFSGLISGTQDVVAPLSDALGVISEALDLASTLLISLKLPGLGEALAILIEQFKRDFLATGISKLSFWDFSVRQFQTSGTSGTNIQQLLDLLADKLIDSTDPDRPTHSSSTAVAILTAAAPGLGPLSSIIDFAIAAFTNDSDIVRTKEALSYFQLKSVLEEDGIQLALAATPDEITSRVTIVKKAVRKLLEIEPATLAEIEIPAVGDLDTFEEILTLIGVIDDSIVSIPYPNWSITAIADVIPGLQDVLTRTLDPVVAMLQSGQDIVEGLNDLIDNLTAKIAALNEFLQELDDFIASLEALARLDGFNILFITTESGVQDLATQIRASASSYPIQEGFYVGMMYVAGGPSLTPFENFFAPVVS